MVIVIASFSPGIYYAHQFFLRMYFDRPCTHVYAVMDVLQQEPGLTFNMDRTTVYLNEVQARQVRFLAGQRAKAKTFCQGPSVSKSNGTYDELPSQKRTAHVNYLSTPGSQDYCKVAMHMTGCRLMNHL